MGAYPAGVFDEVSAEAMLQENPPIYFERNLTNMAAIAQAHGIDVVLLTFATSPTSNPRAGAPEIQAGIAEGNEIVERVAGAMGVYLYEFAADMPTGRQYFDGDGHHFTRAGNALRASLIGEYLIGIGILPE